ncbi:MAG: M23 family metallopeptidase, partial [Candidatus Kerfeldbacteria bacterium]|nr:M23 family metallopeptidase [Candidatus Kerfeldbacteria bacterium]
MERYVRIFLLSIFVMLGLTNNSEAADIASSFEFPVPNYNVTGYDFGDTVSSDVLHLGEDATAAALDPIYASANGHIVPSPITGWHESYGYVVVIEHELPDGDIVYSVSGHMRSEGLKTSGDVSQGDVIGYAGYDDENGDGGPHLHFGIYYGSYSGSWVFYGRGTNTANWYDPTDFITSHQIDCTDYSSEISAVKTSYGSFIGTATNDPHLYYQNGEYSDNVCIRD